MTAPNELAARTVLAALATSRVGAPPEGEDLHAWFRSTRLAAVDGLSSGERVLWRMARTLFEHDEVVLYSGDVRRLDDSCRALVLSAFGEWIDVPVSAAEHTT